MEHTPLAHTFFNLCVKLTQSHDARVENKVCLLLLLSDSFSHLVVDGNIVAVEKASDAVAVEKVLKVSHRLHFSPRELLVYFFRRVFYSVLIEDDFAPRDLVLQFP